MYELPNINMDLSQIDFVATETEVVKTVKYTEWSIVPMAGSKEEALFQAWTWDIGE